MTLVTMLALGAAATALIGGVVLAFATGRILWEVVFAINAVSTSIQSIVSTSDVYVFNGLDERLKSAMKNARRLTLLGVVLLAVSFLCSILAALRSGGAF